MNLTSDQIQAILSYYKYPERMQSSQLFHNIILSIAQGVSPHTIIEDLVTMIEDQQKALEEKPRVIYASVPLSDEGERLLEFTKREKAMMGQMCGVPMELMEQAKASELTSEEYNLIYGAWLDQQPNAK